jgi:regulatory protein
VASGEHSKKVKVYLDGTYAFSVEAAVALEAKLRLNQELNQSGLETLERENQAKKALAAANNILSFRPRSEKELRQKLSQKGYDSPTIAGCIDHLKELGLVNDAAFARYWAENRASFSPRSGRMVNLELRQKGVPSELAEATCEGVDDDCAAYDAGYKKASRLVTADYEEFRRKVGEYLKRRGFGYEVIDRSLKKLWEQIAHKE